MEELKQVHAKMHELIAEVVRNRQRGDQQAAEALFTRVERYSDRIVELLDLLEQMATAGEESASSAVGDDEAVWHHF
jgi:hypothetical protein